MIVGHPHAGVAVVDPGVLELDLGHWPSWPLVEKLKASCRLSCGVEQVRRPLPCRGRLIGEKCGETFFVAIADELVEVGDKVGPGKKRRWSRRELDDEGFGSESGSPLAHETMSSLRCKSNRVLGPIRLTASSAHLIWTSETYGRRPSGRRVAPGSQIAVC